MMKKRFNVQAAIFFAVLMITSSATIAAQEAKRARQRAKPNTLTAQQSKQGFKLLFDGKSLEHFKAVTKDVIPEGCWLVKKGQIICSPKDGRPEGAGGSIVTKKLYSNFDLRFQYKLDPDFKGNVNSGIKYFAYPGTELGLEFQLYDHDAEVSKLHALADLYDLLPAEERPAKPRGQWNRVKIVAKGNTVQHWLNNKKVLKFERGSEVFRAAVAKSKFKDRDKFGEARQGHILLQDHGGGIAFRSLKIRATDPR
ncbi:MAG: DUF1080 domain-containing protein [Phycisphaeraceae bacterium]|nr:DUF1080 domain-containing protein [Phycisphaeraceae bacterium]